MPGGTTPYWNDFGVWKQINGEQNDFNVLMGDTIYSDTEVPGYTLSDVALTKEQKWAAYKTNLGQKPLDQGAGLDRLLRALRRPRVRQRLRRPSRTRFPLVGRRP